MDDTPMLPDSPAATAAFIARWKAASGTELANAQLFVIELCELLGLPRPEPASDDLRDNAYVFERRIRERLADGSEAERRVDCYRRGAFVLEAKGLTRKQATPGFDEALMKARAQAEGYARALPADEGRPPFLVVVDVGRVIELYSEFSRSGATYVQFPDARSYRIRLDDLARDDIRARLKHVWLDPDALDPSKIAAAATREVAEDLARIARSLEASGHPAESVAGFLTRCLFTFFAEDVGLLPARAFETLLADLAKAPAPFVPMVGELWAAMDAGRFSVAIRADVRRFNGKLFKHPEVLPLDRDQIGLLHACARRQWSAVEPAIIGTLLERALDPRERHKLGAHYTPRAYVERLVLPTVIEPLRADWAIAQATALSLARDGKPDAAAEALRHFHHALCSVRVLDPACGSGNFLYVTLEHLKRLEGEVLDVLGSLTGGQQKLETEGLTVDPHQLLGIEVNPRAAALAELVLWIGYLQWHYRTRGGSAEPPLPVLKDYGNVRCRDAVLAWDTIDFVTDTHGVPVSRWDGRTMKAHPVTGEPVPDDGARLPVERYEGVRVADPWPEADFIVGNPPYIGNKRMRTLLGDGYVEALRAAWTDVSDGADFVMYWWHRAAQMTREGRCRAFGLITTNSLRQITNRAVMAPHLEAGTGLRLSFVVPDHPWIDSGDGADVRVALSVAGRADVAGRLLEVVDEEAGHDGEYAIQFRESAGPVHADLSTGADVGSTPALRSNEGLSFQGCKLVGDGFRLDEYTSTQLKLVDGDGLRLRRYVTGTDVTKTRDPEWVIDLFGISEADGREQYPALYQHLRDHVKPFRDHVARKSHRDRWWLFGEPRPGMRKALDGLKRYAATSEVAKHRIFVRLGWPEELADGSLMVIALDAPGNFGVLSSRIHSVWSLAGGGRMGVGNDSRYNNTRCFEPFPFPDLDRADSLGAPLGSAVESGDGTAAPARVAGEAMAARIGRLAEAIDSHRKRQQAAHPGLTLTGMYNVLDQLRRGAALNPKEKLIHEQGLVSVLASLHDELDAAVLAAYGWSDLAGALVGKPGGTLPYPEADEAQQAAESLLLARLVALNAERAAEEARGLVRWLRPEFQDPARAGAAAAAATPEQAEAELDGGEAAPAPADPATAKPAKAGAVARMPWPAELPAQMRALTELFAGSRAPLTLDAIADRYSTRGKWKARLPELIGTLEAIGQIRAVGDGWLAAR